MRLRDINPSHIQFDPFDRISAYTLKSTMFYGPTEKKRTCQREVLFKLNGVRIAPNYGKQTNLTRKYFRVNVVELSCSNYSNIIAIDSQLVSQERSKENLKERGYIPLLRVEKEDNTKFVTLQIPTTVSGPWGVPDPSEVLIIDKRGNDITSSVKSLPSVFPVGSKVNILFKFSCAYQGSWGCSIVLTVMLCD